VRQTPIGDRLPWPEQAPRDGDTMLRRFRTGDAAMAVRLAGDPYWPLVSTLPAHATSDEASRWVDRQIRRWEQGIGFSFAIADAVTGDAVGQAGLWLRELADGRATAGYSVGPEQRGCGRGASALRALTRFAWTIDGLHRVELYIEPDNEASIRTAGAAGYRREGLLRSHRSIGGTRRDMLLLATVRDDRTEGGPALP